MRIHVTSYIVLLALLLIPSVTVRAQSSSSVFQTGLATEKSSYKIGETVYVTLRLYNPTTQHVAVRFSGGCWLSFVVRDAYGALVHNETWPACDPNINGLENVTNVMTVDPGGGRWYSLSWNQLDMSGRHVPVPGDYVLSWSFRNPDQPVPAASTIIHLTDQVQSQLDAFSGPASRFLLGFTPLLSVLALFPGTIPWSRAMKRTKRLSRIIFALPAMVVVISTGVILLGYYSNQLLCLGIQCSETISFLASLNAYLLIAPVVWAVMFLTGRLVREKLVWIPLAVFESSTAFAVIVSYSILNSMHQLWLNTFYYDWTLAWPSYAVLVSIIPAQLLFYKAFKAKLLAMGLFKPEPPKPRTFLDLQRP